MTDTSTVYYNSSTNGFYDSRIGGIPTGSVNISTSDYENLMTAIHCGALLSADSSGNPVIKTASGATIALSDVDSSVWYGSTLTLAQKASSAIATARTYVTNNYTMLNEPTPDAWVTYLKALMAIANGTDTTSTELPTAPTS